MGASWDRPWSEINKRMLALLYRCIGNEERMWILAK